MILHIRTDGPVPPYEQIRAQITEMIAAATLPAGYRLPSIRQLASDLGLAPGTIARAYRELEREGIVVTRPGRGTSVSVSPRPLPEKARQRRLREAARAYADIVHRLGATRDQAISAVADQLAPDDPVTGTSA